MNRLTILAFAVAALAGLTGCGKSAPDADDQPTKTPADTNTEAGLGVTLDAATQERLALATAHPVAIDWQPELKAYGQVLDPATLQTSLMELSRAEIALDASQQELTRARVLQGQNNISIHAFQDIETTYDQNLADARAIQLKIKTAWGSKITDLLGAVAPTVGTERKLNPQLTNLTDNSSLIRVDLPAGEQLAADAVGTVRIAPFGADAATMEATAFDRLPTIDPQTQQQSWLCVAERSPANSLLPGEAVTAFIQQSGTPIHGVIVPISAIVRFQGAGWIYVQTATNRFSRELIQLNRPAPGGWFVSAGLSATNRIVITGVQSVLSAELSGNGFTTGERD